jgi:hypothetical protein
MEMLQTHLTRPPESETDASTASGSACPFSATVQEAFNATQGDLRLSVVAAQRLDRAPSFVRAMIRRGIEEFARAQGYAEVTSQVMDEVRARMGSRHRGSL